jgi:hypothetical protein
MVRMYQNQKYDYYCQIVAQNVCDVHHIHEPLFSQLLNIETKKNMFLKTQLCYSFPLPIYMDMKRKINKCLSWYLNDFNINLIIFCFVEFLKNLFNTWAKIWIKSKVQLSSLNHRPSNILTWNWDSLNTLDYFMTLKKTSLFFYITITCQRF